MFLFCEIDGVFAIFVPQKEKAAGIGSMRNEYLFYVFRDAFRRFGLCAHRDEIDEERDKYADQGIEHAVESEIGNGGIRTVGDRDAQKSDARDIGQCAFAHEIGEENQRRDSEEIVLPGFVEKMGKRSSFEGFRQKHQRNDAEGNQEIF